MRNGSTGGLQPLLFVLFRYLCLDSGLCLVLSGGTLFSERPPSACSQTMRQDKSKLSRSEAAKRRRRGGGGLLAFFESGDPYASFPRRSVLMLSSRSLQNELYSKLRVSSLLTPIILPYIIPYTTPRLRSLGYSSNGPLTPWPCGLHEPDSARVHRWLSKLWSLFGYPKY